MNILCIDIGNSRTHVATASDAALSASQHLGTSRIAQELPPLLASCTFDTLAFCSVVPAATEELLAIAEQNTFPLYHLTHTDCPGLAITYPQPSEIGQDRLANCIGAQLLTGAPAVVIDIGTATTFDIVVPEQGYIGGIIAPGLRLMTHYLHEQTAQLPLLDTEALIHGDRPAVIGTSTVDAMRAGCSYGFTGMIQALLEKVRAQLEARGWPEVPVLLTGGNAGMLLPELADKGRHEPGLTLLGLAEACRRKCSGA